MSRFAVALDIDGVLIRGKQLLPGTRPALKKLYSKNVPVIFLTNGGGVCEETKAKQMTELFQVPIDQNQVVLAHSPMRQLRGKHCSPTSNVLLVGPDSVKDVALKYGFLNPILPGEIVHHWPAAWPWPSLPLSISSQRKPEYEAQNINISAVAVLHDSRDWGRDLQLVLDALLSDKGKLGTRHPTLLKHQHQHRSDDDSAVKFKPSVPIYFSNPDFLWATDFPALRFGQGAFRRALEHLYRELTGGSELQIDGQWGKPYPGTYEYAEKTLAALPNSKGKAEKVYMIGDNPMSDILGANNYGWHSILVRTGVFSGEKPTDLPDDLIDLKPSIVPLGARGGGASIRPKTVCADLEEAVDYLLSREEH